MCTYYFYDNATGELSTLDWNGLELLVKLKSFFPDETVYCVDPFGKHTFYIS
jgi:hypothetical protein